MSLALKHLESTLSLRAVRFLVSATSVVFIASAFPTSVVPAATASCHETQDNALAQK